MSCSLSDSCCSNVERGSALLYVLVAVPVVFALSIFSLDLSRVYASQAAAQREADRISLQASTYLPDVSAARQFLSIALAQAVETPSLGSRMPQPHVLVTPSEIHLSLRGSLRPLLASLLPSPKIQRLQLSYQSSARVEIVPLDVVLLFSDGRRAAPPFPETWGSAHEWPLSPVLHTLRIPCSLEDCPLQQHENYRRWLTQRCYNPYFSPVKQAIIDAVRYLRAGAVHRLAVLSTPGEASGPGYEVLSRSFTVGDALRSAVWKDQGSDSLLNDDLCAYLSDSTMLSENPYRFPGTAGPHCSHYRAGLMPLVFQPEGSLSTCFLSQMSLEQRIWLHAVREQELSAAAFENAVNEALRLLLQSPPAVHGSLEGRARRLIVALLGEELPLSSALMQRLQELQTDLLLISFSAPQGEQRPSRLSYAGGSVYHFSVRSVEQLRRVLAEEVLSRYRSSVLKS